MSKPKYLLDVNMLIALTDTDHVHHPRVTTWFHTDGQHDWGVCTFTESGFVRITSNPGVGHRTVEQATQLLRLLARHAGYRYWPISTAWISLVEPFRERIVGHQQITDSILLGLAVQEDGILVSMDKALQYLAGPRLSQHVLILE